MSNGDRKSDNRTILHTRLSEQELVEIDRAVYRNRELTGPQLNARFRLRRGVYGGYATVWLSGRDSITKQPSFSYYSFLYYNIPCVFLFINSFINS